MAKQFEIVFSTEKDLISSVSESGGKEDKTKSDIEKLVLKNLFHIAAAQQKDIGNYLECKDCISQIDNLKDSSVLLLTEGDLKYLKEGFEKTAGNRPFFWIEHCENLFRQISKPVEHKE